MRSMISSTLFLALSLASPAAAESATLCRVTSVEGATVTLEVVSGAVVNGDSLELFAAGRKTTVTVKLPSTIDLLLKGDKVAGVTLTGATAVVGGLLATKGAFATADAATRALGSEPAAAPAPSAAGLKPSTAGCVFTPEELTRALGFTVGAGKGTELPFSGGTSLSCQWAEPKGLRAVVVNRQVMTSGNPETNRLAMRKMLAGRLEDVAGDPDHAAWQVDQGDLTNVTLHYFRENTGTEIRLLGVNMKNRAVVDDLRRRVLGLRRR